MKVQYQIGRPNESGIIIADGEGEMIAAFTNYGDALHWLREREWSQHQPVQDNIPDTTSRMPNVVRRMVGK
jgi:hypothetical protein